MSETIQLVCAGCAQLNRVAVARLADRPRCGTCKQALLPGRPLALDDEHFERFVAGSGLPLVVDCWAPWCAPCRQMAPAFEQAAARLAPDVILAKLDTDAAPLSAARLSIRSIPTLIVFRDGFEIARQSGALDLTRLLAFVAPHVTRASGHA